jgi:TldD protein
VAAVWALLVSLTFLWKEAYLIENGKITKPLKGATLIGEAKEIMNKISMCSQDLTLAAGFCGSISGSIYVKSGSLTSR